mmetsp:Transcript_8780/g.14234  ORF Transcript_8780/g.14234 Transcript_8780/m.14234 type:complete len:211 (+) Transcript_8780:1283-1915(+)
MIGTELSQLPRRLVIIQETLTNERGQLIGATEIIDIPRLGIVLFLMPVNVLNHACKRPKYCRIQNRPNQHCDYRKYALITTCRTHVTITHGRQRCIRPINRCCVLKIKRLTFQPVGPTCAPTHDNVTALIGSLKPTQCIKATSNHMSCKTKRKQKPSDSTRRRVDHIINFEHEMEKTQQLEKHQNTMRSVVTTHAKYGSYQICRQSCNQI